MIYTASFPRYRSMSIVLEAPCNPQFIILEPNITHLNWSFKLHVMVHYKSTFAYYSNKFANQAQQYMGTAIWTESWAFETCPVAFCYWSALTSSSLALELFFLCSPWFSDNISLCFSLFSSQSGDKPLIKGPGKRDIFHTLPRGQVVVAKSLVCPRGSGDQDFNWPIH